jgi:hypothetical protein
MQENVFRERVTLPVRYPTDGVDTSVSPRKHANVAEQDSNELISVLALSFFAEASALIEGPWAMAAIPDLAHPGTRGERPADLEQQLKVGLAMNKLAARDPAVHKLLAEVQHLLKPPSVLQEPELRQRVQAVLAEE